MSQAAKTPIRVVIADDHPVVRDGLSVLLSLMSDIVVVGKAADGEDALTTVLRTEPDVVLMDLRMPGLDGIEATRRILAAHPAVKVVVLTTYPDADEAAAAFDAGALGYLTKDAERQDIYQTLVAAAAGRSLEGRWTAPRATERPRRRVGLPDGLTSREVEVLRLIAAGRSNREIVESLHVSEATVKTHINRIYAKTRVRDRAQAVRYAYVQGLASSGDGGPD